MAMACEDPLTAYEKLRIGYSRNTFTITDTAQTISDTLARNVNDFISDRDIPFILGNHRFDLAVHTVRTIGPASSENKRIQGLALLGTALGNVATPRAMDVWFHRTVFYSGVREPEFLRRSFRGSAHRLSAENIRQVGLATGSLPYLIRGVHDIPGGRKGVYRDGGLIDYQLNQDYCPGPESLTLFFHYRERIVPGWFDKALKWRKPAAAAMDRVLQVYPGPDFVDLLPDRRIPDRKDFTMFVDNPAERIRRWDEVSKVSEILGQEFLEDVESSRIRELVEPIGKR